MPKLLLSLILSWVCVYSLHSQTAEPINFTYIGLNEGLSQSTVFDITQDKRGNMWFATNNGLNKYDSYKFTVYQHDEKDKNSIEGDIIRVVKADSQGRIWAGTDKGLSLYDAAKDCFYNFQYPKNRRNLPVNEITEVNEKLLLILTEQELVLFNSETRTFANDQLNPELFTIIPTAIYQQGDLIYIGSYKGLMAYSISKNSLKTVATESLKGSQILSILQQSPTRLWVGSEGNGLFLINPLNGTVKNYMTTTQQPISSNYVRSLALDAQNRLWVGTISSLNIYQEENDSFITYESNPLIKGSLSQTSVRCIFMDSQRGMWLGTYFGGLNYYHPLKNRFKQIQFVPNRNSLNDNIVSCMVEDSQKNLWIGTNSGGVNLYNPKSHTFTQYTQKNGLGSNDIKAIYVDETLNNVYIGMHAGGLSMLHRATGQIETFKHLHTPELTAQNVYAITPAGNNEYWLATLEGVVRFNPQQKTFVPVPTEKDGKPFRSTRITTIFRDSKNRLWFGSEEGLIVYNQHQDKLQSTSLLPTATVNQRFVNCVYEGTDGVFWIGTRSGMYRYNEAKKSIKQYTLTNGLPNNVVYGILEDSYGKLWISTDKGLSCFQPKTETFRNFTSIDGLQSNQFTAYSYCRTTNGQMYFGGVNGITSFHPDKLVDNPYVPPVSITSLHLFNQLVRPDDENGILEKSISETNSITLVANQSMFSLEFVVANYISGKHNTFAYKLDGYDKDWYYATDLHTASYSNLPHGTYRFLVKAANSDGRWNETPTELEIIILPVWYKTWWAFLLFAAVFIAATIFVFRYFWMRKSMETQLQIERMDKERQKEVNEMKLRFFINISHELRTPLTLILAPLQDILEKVDDRWLRKQLEHIQKNTNRLLHLVNQLMDYRRAELGVFNLQVRRTLIYPIIEKNFLFYDRVAQRKEIDYNLYSEIEGQEVLCDPNYLELITNNLLSNAFKYTGEGKSITLTLKVVDKMLLLQVKDTGKGIPIDKQGKIFERFFQIDNEHLGSGIGLSLVQRLVELHHGHIELESSKETGSTFSIFLPIEETAYKQEELGNNETFENHSTNNQDMYIVDTESKEKEDKTETTETKKRRKETILIVEDNPDILHYLCDELGNTYTILKAENGEEAISLVKDKNVDLVLTDVMMPVMDGLQLCKLIKQNLRTCHIPVIILSAKADIKEQLEGLQVGADDYIPKPFSLILVTTKIKNLFRTRYRAIEHYSQSLEIEPEKVALNPLDEEFLKKAVAIVERHMDDIEFTTDEFASDMCMSRSNLHLKMKALTGESTNEFIRKIRFNLACKLLKEGRYTVAEISSMVGFNTPSYFATSFKKFFGCLPSEYTKKG